MLRSRPPTLGVQPFPCGHRRQRSDDRRLLPLPACFDAQDTEAAFVVVEGDALDQTGDFLGRGSALDCGVHLVGSYFPTDRVNRSDAQTIRHALGQLSAKGSVRKSGDAFVVEAKMEGASARDSNRTFLSALRKVEKKTTLRAEWTSGDTTERYFDYVLKKTTKN